MVGSMVAASKSQVRVLPWPAGWPHLSVLSQFCPLRERVLLVCSVCLAGPAVGSFGGAECIVAAEACVAHGRCSVIDGPVLDWLDCSSDSRGWHILPLSPRSCLALSWVSGPAS